MISTEMVTVTMNDKPLGISHAKVCKATHVLNLAIIYIMDFPLPLAKTAGHYTFIRDHLLKAI